MKVHVKVFAKITEKGGIGKKNRTAFEQSAQLVQEADGMPDCPVTITHWDDKSKCLVPGLYEAELYFEPAPFGQMLPRLEGFKPSASRSAAQPPIRVAGN